MYNITPDADEVHRIDDISTFYAGCREAYMVSELLSIWFSPNQVYI